MPDPLAYSVPETCELIGSGRSTIYEEIRAGRLKARKLRGRTLILHDDLVDYLRHLPTRQDIAADSETATA